MNLILKKYTILKSILFLFSSFHVFSQSSSSIKGSEISGKVLNQSHLDIVYASIALIKNDSTLINSTISTANGTFKILNVNPGIYMLRIDHIEHETHFTDPFTLSLNEYKTIPDIILLPASNTLDEVLITQKKALIEIKADKLIFNVSSSPSASGTNGLDLLKKSPGVTVDLDNNANQGLRTIKKQA
jgi:iron complex outermembrane receptor protein